MSKIINDEIVSSKERQELMSSIDRYIKAHNAWVELYDMFRENPTLSRFLDEAYGECLADPNGDISKNTGEGFPKIYCMKRAIEKMTAIIENKINPPVLTDTARYQVLLENAAKCSNIRIELFDYMVRNFDELKEAVIEDGGTLKILPHQRLNLVLFYENRPREVMLSYDDIRNLFSLVKFYKKCKKGIANDD